MEMYTWNNFNFSFITAYRLKPTKPYFMVEKKSYLNQNQGVLHKWHLKLLLFIYLYDFYHK